MKIIGLVFCLIILFASLAFADSMKGPWEAEFSHEKKAEISSAAGFMMNIYQKYISPLAGGSRCPMTPGCSNYSKTCFHRHGAVFGVIMTTDRLMRCGRSETKDAREVWVDGEKKYYDPVENNEWLWTH